MARVLNTSKEMQQVHHPRSKSHLGVCNINKKVTSEEEDFKVLLNPNENNNNCSLENMQFSPGMCNSFNMISSSG
jgi:hypothetical protein